MNSLELTCETKVYTLKTDRTYVIVGNDVLDYKVDEFVIEIIYENGLEDECKIYAQLIPLSEEGQILLQGAIHTEIAEIFDRLLEEGVA